MTRNVITHSPEETRRLGMDIGLALRGGEVIALIGPLGAGKTQLVKGIAVGNDWPEEGQVTSPTFTLVNEYPGRLCLYHLDAYRLKDSGELEALGFDEMISPESAVIVEWADRAEEALPEDRLTVRIKPISADTRELSITARGAASEAFFERLAETRTAT